MVAAVARWAAGLVLVVLVVLVGGVVGEDRFWGGGDVALLEQRVRAAILPTSPVATLPAFVSHATTQLTADCAFDDINYNDTDGRSWWLTRTLLFSLHLQRVMLMAIELATNSSAEPSLRNRTNCALQYWLDNDFINDNWWWNEIGTPHIVAKILLTLNPSPDMLERAQPILARATLSAAAAATGCNRVWASGSFPPACSPSFLRMLLAQNNIFRGLLERGNTTRLRTAFDLIYSTAISQCRRFPPQRTGAACQALTTALYMGWGYGSIFTANMLSITSWAANTSYAIDTDPWNVLAQYILKGQRLATRGPNFDYTTSGRLMTYFVQNDEFNINQGHYHYFAAFTDFRLAFPAFEPPRLTPLAVIFAPLLPEVSPSAPQSSELQAFGKCLLTTETCDRPAETVHYYDSDYLVHQRPNLTISLRMFSNRTINSECINGENLQGRALADGVVNLFQTGREYENIFPVWNWKRLPGTTELQSPTEYTCATVQDVIHRPWTGAASDGQVAAATMDFARGHSDHIYAAKSWFFYDDAVIALAANLSSTDLSYNLTTSLDQRLLNGPVLIEWTNGSQTEFAANQSVSLMGVQALRHDGIRYDLELSPDAVIELSTEVQRGSWADITQGPSNPVAHAVFSLSVVHGVGKAVTPTCAYRLTREDSAPDTSKVTVISNDEAVQAVMVQTTDAATVFIVQRQVMSTAYLARLSQQQHASLGWSVTPLSVGIVTVRQAVGSSEVELAVNNPHLEARPMNVVLNLNGLTCPGATNDRVIVELPEHTHGASTLVACTIVQS
ncbi:uncharacterized protein MONBRDRAFT_25569 [Monosiga brevicollis MX1]|uniref:Polysaccharide lyase family 8 central domain-containing protein n=1 Tax=Monosiga brevicollis TaxID=81824 RepID=A9UZT2_MONBE|nr:uncharacterized protein MONBRDRAFT_25569 [Monosiga brevicollis MX1]EDQ89421.1 predicted protein [Monosiga brevicollis MX1]|eukprot:XP_001745997.1 hypothetical protein [Monosiga brevicollis MX1]